jgi:hypothetical protein
VVEILVVDPACSAVIVALIAGIFTILGAQIAKQSARKVAKTTLEGQLALDDHRALRERRARSVESFLEWAYSRDPIYVDVIVAARDGNVERMLTLLEKAAEIHPNQDARWKVVDSDRFQTAAHAFLDADSSLSALLRQHLSTASRRQFEATRQQAIESEDQRSLPDRLRAAAAEIKLEGNQPLVSRLRSAGVEVEAAANAYVVYGSDRPVLAPEQHPRWRLWRRSND